MNCGPILCICYTNHALDQFLEHLLEKGVENIVRIGARSKSEALADYNLATLMASREKPFQVRQTLREAFEQGDIVSEEIEEMENAFRSPKLAWEYLSMHLGILYPEHLDQLEYGYETSLYQHGLDVQEQLEDADDDDDDDDADGDDDDDNEEDEDDEGYETVLHGRRTKNLSNYEQWIRCADIRQKERYNASITTKKPQSKKKNMYAVLNDDWNRPAAQPRLLPVPTTNRPLDVLHEESVWDMSEVERRRLQESWKPAVQALMMDRMEILLNRAKDVQNSKNQAFDEIRRTIVRGASVIGMTTNGAAKMQDLIANVAPKIIICEEAGEVLECHIISALTPSTQHLILIGDHLQLRPQIETYNLSSDSRIGAHYNLDRSLFERLVTSQTNRLPLSHMITQRRMRPEISSLIRTTLYPNLEDGGNALLHPDVSGMAENLYFMDHSHPEDAKDQYGMQSFSNTFEVEMVESLANYLIKNGYDQPGDIAILTPYLGQLSKLRDRLSRSFMLIIDDRDLEKLDENEAVEDNGNDAATGTQGVNAAAKVKNIKLNNHLTLRTIDNYQVSFME